LRAEFNDPSLIRFNAPDNGVDILHRNVQRAYQCKSDERGAFGSISAEESIKSLQTAYRNKEQLKWNKYNFSTNANYTGTSFTKIIEEAKRLGLEDSQIEFYGPEYWDDLCSKHFNKVRDRFDYRISVTEKQVIDAFKKARYFDKYVKEYESLISKSKFYVIITNNRTPLELKIPFSPDLSVENCLDVVKELLGISLEWTNFTDLGTSAGLSLSLTINRYAQRFSKKIKELPLKEGDKLQLWIKIVWEDKRDEKGVDVDKIYYMFEKYEEFKAHFYLLSEHISLRPLLNSLGISYNEMSRENISYENRRQITLNRAESLVQAMIWKSAIVLKSSIK